MHIIIDGYNLIRQSETFNRLDLEDIQLGREALVESLSEYRKAKRHRITVVFDGTNAAGFESRRDRCKGIEIRFSRNGETADAVIKRMAAREGEKALIVSSDREVAGFSASRGSTTIDSADFEERMALAVGAGGLMDTQGDNDLEGWRPTTRKKGPSRRLPKKDRQRRRKFKKL